MRALRLSLGLFSLFSLLSLLNGCTALTLHDQCETTNDCSAGLRCEEHRCKGRVVEVRGPISFDTTWSADSAYILKREVRVTGSARLLIEPGTRILAEKGSALVVESDARLEAVGTAEQPILFTSAARVGARKAGDWGGVVLLGLGPILGPNNQARFKELPTPPVYGGAILENACGSLRHVRIEFAGDHLTAGAALAGLTLAGCGSTTELNRVEVHRVAGDGIAILGGTVKLSEVLVSHAEDDALDWDEGWMGQLTRLVVIQGPEADSAIEASLAHEAPERPWPSPKLEEIALLGDKLGHGSGIQLRANAQAIIKDVLIQDHSEGGLALRDPSVLAQLKSGRLQLENLRLVDSALFTQDSLKPAESEDPRLVPTGGERSPSALPKWTEGWTAFPPD